MQSEAAFFDVSGEGDMRGMGWSGAGWTEAKLEMQIRRGE